MTGTMATVAALATVVPRLSSSLSSSSFHVRPFDPARDQLALEQICQNVYGGNDYLPKTAAMLAVDPNSTFLVLCEESNNELNNTSTHNNHQPIVVAVANARELKPGMSWLEAVRTHPSYRGQGLAAQLIQQLLDHQTTSPPSSQQLYYTCTVASNQPMRRVFQKTGFSLLHHRIHQLSFAKLVDLPGWSADEDDDRTPPETLLHYYQLEEMIRPEAREQRWSLVETRQELEVVLQRIQQSGGMGHLPALYELLSEDVIKECLSHGRLWKLFDEAAASEDDDVAGVLAFSREDKIRSLRSKWICSIAASSPLALESALWQAHSTNCLATLQGDVAFTLCMDGDLSTALSGSLPLVEDECLLYGTAPLL